MQEDIVLKLRYSLCEVINKSNLPPSIVYFVLKDVYGEMENVYHKYLEVQQQNMQISEEHECVEEINIPINIDEQIKEQVEKQLNKEDAE